MKTSNWILLTGIVILPAFIFMGSGCKSKEKVMKSQGETAVEVPCTGYEFRTDKEHLRAFGMGESMDQSMARKKAMSNANADLASGLKILIKGVTDNYAKSAGQDKKENLMQRYESLTREVVNQELVGTKVICEKQTITKDKTYKTYISIELAESDLLKSITGRVSNDELLKVDYNYEKFKKTFEEEMNKQVLGK